MWFISTIVRNSNIPSLSQTLWLCLLLLRSFVLDWKGLSPLNWISNWCLDERCFWGFGYFIMIGQGQDIWYIYAKIYYVQGELSSLKHSYQKVTMFSIKCWCRYVSYVSYPIFFLGNPERTKTLTVDWSPFSVSASGRVGEGVGWDAMCFCD